MKLIKLLLVLGMISSQNNCFSQSKITIKTQLIVEDETCDETTGTIRDIDIQMLYNNHFTSIKKFQSDKCSMTYSVAKFNGKFKAVVNAEEYLSSEISFEINEKSPDTIVLRTVLHRNDKTRKLNEVIVKSNSVSNLIKMEGNKTSFSIQGNDALNNGTLLETIQKLPGVMSDINGNITLKGKTVTITIDGMSTNMSGQDLTNYLNSISSSSVSKIEITNNPGASFDSNSSGDVINVVTGQKRKKGVFGSIYSATTFYKKKKSENSITLNGQYHKINWNSNLTYNEVESEDGMHKQIRDRNNANYIDDSNLNQNKTRPLSIRTGVAFPVNNNRVDLRFSHTHNNQNIDGQSNYLGYNLPTITTQESIGKQIIKSNRNEVTSIITHKFKNPEKLFTLNYQFYNFNRGGNTQNTSQLMTSEYQSNNTIKFRSQINKLKGDLILPLKSYKINTGFKLTNSAISSDGRYAYIDDISENSNTIQYNYNDYTLAGYTELYKKYNQLELTLGIRYEYLNFKSETNSIENTSQDYSNFFPSFNIGYHLNTLTNINLSYSRKVKLPGYQELDPNTSGMPNRLVSEQGNPLLKPGFYHNAELKIDFFKYAYIDFSYSQANNENYFVLTKNTIDTYNQTFDQFNNVKNFNSSIAIPVPLGVFTKGLKYLSSITDINAVNFFYIVAGSTTTKYQKEDHNTNFNSLYYIGTYAQILLPFDTKMNLQHTFSSKGNYAIYNVVKPYNKLDLTLSKSILNKTTKIQFSYTDILKTAKGFHAAFVNDDLAANIQTLNDSQRIKFSLTYTFGSFKPESKNNLEEIDERENKKSALNPKS